MVYILHKDHLKYTFLIRHFHDVGSISVTGVEFKFLWYYIINCLPAHTMLFSLCDIFNHHHRSLLHPIKTVIIIISNVKNISLGAHNFAMRIIYFSLIVILLLLISNASARDTVEENIEEEDDRNSKSGNLVCCFWWLYKGKQ